MNKITSIVRQRRYKRLRTKIEMVREEGLRLVQVMEFDGQLYISYNGIPLVNVKYVMDTQAVLENARSTRMRFIQKFIIKNDNDV